MTVIVYCIVINYLVCDELALAKVQVPTNIIFHCLVTNILKVTRKIMNSAVNVITTVSMIRISQTVVPMIKMMKVMSVIHNRTISL